MGETTWQGQDPPNNEEIYKYLLEKISQLENRNLELREQLRQLEVEKRYTETQKIRYERDVRKLKSEIERGIQEHLGDRARVTITIGISAFPTDGDSPRELILAGALKAGDLAPDFTLPATLEESITLSQYRGRKNVVLAFYPFDWSPVCSLQLPGIQADLPQFKRLNAVVLGISVGSRLATKPLPNIWGSSSPCCPILTSRCARPMAFSAKAALPSARSL
jgi:hypothetical protein